MKTLTTLACLVLALAAAAPAPASDAPTQKQVLDHWAEALGGRDALTRVETTHLEYKIRMFGMDGTYDQWSTADGRRSMHLSLGGLFEVRSAFACDHGWFVDQNGKLSELGGDDLRQEVSAAYDASMSYLIAGRMPGVVSYEGTEDDTGRHIVLCEPDGGLPITWYLDPSTWLPVRSEIPFGDRTQTTAYGDWQAHDGVMFPGKLVQSQGGDKQYDATFELTAATVNAAPPAGAFDKPVEKESGVTFTDGAPVRDIPLEFNTVHIFLQASVNGSRPLWFVFDTGAAVTVLNTDVARELGLELHGKIEGRGAGEGSREANFIPDVSVSLPGISLAGQTVASIDLTDIQTRMGRAIDGILGYDFISRFVAKIDYHGHALTLYDRHTYDYDGDGAVVPITIEGSSPTIAATVKPFGRDPVTARFLVDTGAGSAVAFARPFAEAHDLAASFPRSFEYVGGFGVGGESSSTVGRIESLALGKLAFRAPCCGIAHDEGGALANPNIAGLIGGVILSRCTVTFDYERQRMILEPNADFDAPFQTNWSGLLVTTGGRGDFHTLTVVRTQSGSPAEEAGLQAGDVVVAADGLEGDALTVHALWEKCLVPGTTLHLTVRRGEETREVTLELRERV